MNNQEGVHPSVLFVSKMCSDKMYNIVVGERTKASLDPSQRLFSAVVEGLRDSGCEVTCISARPFSVNNTNRTVFEREEETINGIRYIYPAFRISPFLRMYDLYRNTKVEVKNWVKDNSESTSVIICDSLVAMCSNPTRKIASKSGIKSIAYVTDYPSLATSIKGKQNPIKALLQRLFDSFADQDLNKYNAYILVSKYLRELISMQDKPYIVVEDVIRTENAGYEPKIQSEDFTIVYGGALCERFGVNKLTEAMKYINIPYAKLVFYGSGESVPFIESREKEDPRIHYGGVLPFEQLQIEQKNADILVNPRPSDETFSKYSFPSKTLSYMLSGTPVLSTKIPGIPNDYHKYLYWFEDEDVKSMADTINMIINTSKEELRNKGFEAYEFAKSSKNPLSQGRRIVEFISRLL